METLNANLRFAVRILRKSPTLSVTIILTLALGIGANTAVYSAIDAVLIRPLPFPRAGELMLLQQVTHKSKTGSVMVAPIRLEDWNRMNSSFQALTGYYTEDVSETSGTLPEKITRAYVAPRFLQVWGVQPALGRDFSAEERTYGGPDAVLISDRLWRQRFNADPGVLGQKLHFGRQAQTIVGVMSPWFLFPVRGVDVFGVIPVPSPYSTSRESTWYTVVGRLKPGVTIDEARSDLNVVQSRLAAQFPKTDGDLGVRMVPLKENIVQTSRESLWVLFAGVSLLLLIACSNIAGLLLARSAQREEEIAIRFALGARRRAIITQLLTEVFLLAFLGSMVGLALSAMAPKVFHAMASDLARVDEITVNWRIVSYSLSCALITTFLCGIFPALRSTHGRPGASLARNSRTQISARSHMQWLLVGVQIALAVTLLISAGLLLRSFQQLGRVAPGFDSSHVLTLHVSASWGETGDMKGLTQRINRTLDVLRATPGIEAAASSGTLPGISRAYTLELKVEEGDVDPEHKIIADMRFVSPGYFATLEIPLLSGEPCREAAGPTGIVVNRSFADTFFGDKNAIGHHLQSTTFASFPLAGEIRGIVADAREQGINVEPMATVYWCISAPVPDPNYLIRTRNDPASMAETVRRVIARAEPSRSVFAVMSLDEQLSNSFAENRMRTILLALFALTAILLASIGLYATLSYIVTVRQREVGLRLALGAQRWQIARRFLWQGLGVSVIGCAFGVIVALGSGRLLAGMLYGVSSHDFTTMFAVVLLVFVVASLAVLLPAVRAARTDPMNALRES
ncbi:MAG TPA: ABC transporter permease [Candidatus Angelobacter sp.]